MVTLVKKKKKKVIKKSFLSFITAALIHWIRQIKDVLATQDVYEIGENTSPLQEIEFWNKRCNNLMSISNQLDKPGIIKITEILSFAKSSYIDAFQRVSQQIKVPYSIK